jgi:hypothetical protein
MNLPRSLALPLILTTLCLLATDAFSETATLDSVDVQNLGDRLLASRDQGSPSQIRLEPKEKVLFLGAKGAVGAALTNRRFLAISDTSSGWKEIRVRGEDGAPFEVELGAHVAFVVTRKRILEFDGLSGLMSEFRFRASESILSSGVQERIGVFVTNVRAIGFAAGSAQAAEQQLQIHEAFETLRVLAATATVRTSRRVLVFRSSTGLWHDDEFLPD